MLALLQDPQKLMAIASLVVAVNVMLSGVHKALEAVKDLTASKALDGPDSLIVKIMNMLSTVSDWIAPRTKKD